MERIRTHEPKHFYAKVASLLNLRTQDSSVMTLVDPQNPENVLIDTEKINAHIMSFFTEHFKFPDRKLTDPSLTSFIVFVSKDQLKEVISAINTQKAMGWSCVPRSIVRTKDEAFLDALRDILEHIITEGSFTGRLQLHETRRAEQEPETDADSHRSEADPDLRYCQGVP